MTNTYFGTPERDPNTEAEHYGVKGMRWGVRRTDEQLGNIDNGNGDGSGGGAGRGGSKVPTIVTNNPQMMGGGPGDDISEEEYQELLDSLTDDEKADLNALLKSGMKIDLPGSIVKLRRGDFARQLASKAATEARNSPKGQIDALIRDTGKMLDKTKKDLDKKLEGLGKNVGDFVKKFKSSVENTTVFTTATATRSKNTQTVSLPQARKLPKSVKSVTGADGTKYRQTNERTEEVRVTTGWNILGGKTYVETKKKETYNGKTTKDTTQKQVIRHSDSEGETLEHFGVKGMRWGFRKSTTRGGTPPSKRNAKPDEGEDSGPKQTPSGKKSVKGLSDQELKDRIQRLQNEKLYNQLTAKPENVVAGIIKRSAKASAEQALTQVSTKLLKQALGAGAEKLMSKKAADAIKETPMDDFAKVFAEAKKTAPKFKLPDPPKRSDDPGTPGNPIFFTATRGDSAPRPTIKLKELGR